MEGRVLREAFAPEYMKAHPVKSGRQAQLVRPATSGYSEEEEQQLSDRLRELGYMD
ncbi:MAG: hypothetical protein GWN58_40365 [Anaerolineae bacterium]|nr:hypothetical protein [Anaerolineae bacterium]